MSPRKPLIASFPKHQLRSQWLAMARAGTSLDLLNLLASSLDNLRIQLFQELCILFKVFLKVFTLSFVQAFCSFSFRIGSKSSRPPSLLPLKDTLVVQLSPLRYSKVITMVILLLLIVAFDVHVHLSTLMATLWSSTASTSWWSKR